MQAMILVVGVVAATTVAGAGAGVRSHQAGGQVCVLMPDTATSIRWVHYDVPALKAEFAKAGVTAQFYNADGDAQKQTQQSQQCLANGAKVIIEVALDAGSAAAIEKAALAKGVQLQVFRADGDRARGAKTVLVSEADHPFFHYWWPPGHIVGWGDTFLHEIVHLLDAIANDGDVAPYGADFEDGYRASEICDALVRSSDEGRRVELAYRALP